MISKYRKFNEQWLRVISFIIYLKINYKLIHIHQRFFNLTFQSSIWTVVKQNAIDNNGIILFIIK